MQHLAERQRVFAEALVDRETPIPPGLVGPDGEPSPRRFGVYRNNVVAGLTDALMAAFPAVSRIVGEEFFRAMARAYVLAEPPCSPILLDYGASFPGFIENFGAASALPYLADVARIERAWTEAYHARDAEPVEATTLARVAPGRIPELRFTMHPSLRIVRSRLPALTIWRMNVADGVPGPVNLAAGGEDSLVLRPRAEVEVRSIPPGGAEFVTGLARGCTLLDAAKAGLGAFSRFDLSSHLAGLLEAGAFVGYDLADVAEPHAMESAG